MLNVLKSVFKVIYRILLNLTVPILVLFATVASLVISFLVKYTTYNQTYTNIVYLLIGLATIVIVSKVMYNNQINPLNIVISLPITLIIALAPTYVIFTKMGYTLESIYDLIIVMLGKEVITYLVTTSIIIFLGSSIKCLLDTTLKGEKQVKKKVLVGKKTKERNNRVGDTKEEVIDNHKDIDIWEDAYLQKQDV